MNQDLTILNDKVSRKYFDIKDNAPIVKFSDNSIHRIIGYKKRKPILEAIFYTYPRVKEYLDLQKTNYIFNSYKYKFAFNPNADGSGSGAVIKANGGYPATFTLGTGDSVQASGEIRTDLAFQYIWRCYYPINTASLGGGATISGITFSAYRNDNDGFSNVDTCSAIVVPQSQASNTTLATSDFGNITRTNKGSVLFSATTNNSYFDITISDLTFVNKTGYTKLALITDRDFNQSTPTGSNLLSFAVATNGTNPVKLTVVYSLGLFMGGGL